MLQTDLLKETSRVHCIRRCLRQSVVCTFTYFQW